MSVAALKSELVYVPKAFISLTLTYEFGGGCLVWVEAIDSMYLRRCQPHRIQKNTAAEEGCGRRGVCVWGGGGYLSDCSL